MISNMDAAIDFYINKLELELLNRYGDHYAEVQAPGLMIGLHPNSEKTIMGNNITIGLGVINFDETIQLLEEKGIAFAIGTDSYIRLANFTDPDGNALFLAERE